MCSVSDLYFLVASCAAETDVAEVQKAIDGQDAKYIAAYNSRDRDADGIAAINTGDDIVMPSDHALVEERPDSLEIKRGVFEAGLKGLKMETLSIDGSRGFFYEVGTVFVIVPIGEKTEFQWPGKYLVVWERQPDEAWKIAVDIWNSDKPLSQVNN